MHSQECSFPPWNPALHRDDVWSTGVANIRSLTVILIAHPRHHLPHSPLTTDILPNPSVGAKVRSWRLSRLSCREGAPHSQIPIRILSLPCGTCHVLCPSGIAQWPTLLACSRAPTLLRLVVCTSMDTLICGIYNAETFCFVNKHT